MPATYRAGDPIRSPDVCVAWNVTPAGTSVSVRRTDRVGTRTSERLGRSVRIRARPAADLGWAACPTSWRSRQAARSSGACASSASTSCSSTRAPTSRRSSKGLAEAETHGVDVPRSIVVPHEHVAMGMAHGYYFATGRAQAVILHTNVGLANGVIGAINAATDHVPGDPDVGPHADGRARPLRRADGADRLGPGDARPGRARARGLQVGLRAALPRAGARAARPGRTPSRRRHPRVPSTSACRARCCASPARPTSSAAPIPMQPRRSSPSPEQLAGGRPSCSPAPSAR